jgi:hypothetical protein
MMKDKNRGLYQKKKKDKNIGVKKSKQSLFTVIVEV